MINVTKIQSDCIKKLVKGERVMWCEVNEDVWVTTDGYCAYKIPKTLFFVDVRSEQSPALEELVSNFDYSEAVKPTGDMRMLEKFNAIKFMTADGKEHWMNVKNNVCESWSVYKTAFFGCNNGILDVIVMGVRVKV